MLLKILKGRNTILLILTPVVLLLLWLPVFVNNEVVESSYHQMPLYELLRLVVGDSPFVLNVLAFFIVLFIAFGMVRLNERYVFIRQRTDLPALMFVLLSAGTISLKGMHPSLLAAFFLFIAIERMFSIYHGNKTLSNSFIVGLLIGLACLCYLFAGIYIVWFWISLGVLGYFRLRETLAGLLGLFTPLFIVACLFFWSDNLPELLTSVRNLFFAGSNVSAHSVYQYIYWGIIALIVGTSSMYMLAVYEEKKISSRKYFILLLSFFLFSAFSFFVFQAAGTEQYFIGILPVTYITSHYFVLQKHKWFGEVLFLLFIVASIVIHFLG